MANFYSSSTSSTTLTTSSTSSTSRQLTPADFTVNFPHLQEGGWGKVYSARLKNDENVKVAMKFFGYTRQRPSYEEIMKEINLMRSLKGVEGVVQIIGTFNDTTTGISK